METDGGSSRVLESRTLRTSGRVWKMAFAKRQGAKGYGKWRRQLMGIESLRLQSAKRVETSDASCGVWAAASAKGREVCILVTSAER